MTKDSKNLAEVTPNRKAGRGTTATEKVDVKGKIIEFAWWMNKKEYAKTTIRVNLSILNMLSEKGTGISNSGSVKEAIEKQKWSSARKHSAIASYTLFLKMLEWKWEPSLCKVTRKLSFIPKEAGNLLWTNIDLERRTITLNQPEKGGNPMIFKVRNKLIAMLNVLPKTNQRAFGDSSISSKRSAFFQTEKTLARKLQNPRLLRISLHTLRRWKATMLYHQTKTYSTSNSSRAPKN